MSLKSNAQIFLLAALTSPLAAQTAAKTHAHPQHVPTDAEVTKLVATIDDIGARTAQRLAHIDLTKPENNKTLEIAAINLISGISFAGAPQGQGAEYFKSALEAQLAIAHADASQAANNPGAWIATKEDLIRVSGYLRAAADVATYGVK